MRTKESNNKSDIKELIQKQFEERANNPEEGEDDDDEE